MKLEMQNQNQKPKYFVFMKQNGVCYPQLWMDDLVKGTGEFQHGEVNDEGPLVFFHHLTEEEKELSLDQLSEKFKEKLNEKGLVHYHDFELKQRSRSSGS